jgi:formate hydrogenlyase subunit 3/multisubunit Na+/H+ antiporter MnhD subunit
LPGIFSTLLGSILALWIGALVLHLVGRFYPVERHETVGSGVAEALALILAIGFLLGTQATGEPLYLGQSEPALPAETLPVLSAGRASTVVALILLGTALMSTLASLFAPGPLALGERAARLAALGAALLFLFAGSWATLALAWVLVDVALLYLMEMHPGRQDAGAPDRRGAPRGWTGLLSLGGAVLLSAVLLPWQQAGKSMWVDPGTAAGWMSAADWSPSVDLRPYAAALSVLAALLRMMPFPLSSWWNQPVPQQGSARSGTHILSFALPTALGAYLWMRMNQWGILAQDSPWLTIVLLWGALALLAAAVKAWAAADPPSLVACAIPYGQALVLLSLGLNLSPGWLLAIVLHVVLSVSTLLLSWAQCQYLRVANLRSYLRIVPFGLALLSLAGLPLTIGFPARVSLYYALFGGQHWLCLLLLMGAEAAFLGVMARLLFEIEPEDAGDDKGPEAAPAPSSERPWPAVWVERGRRELGYGAAAVWAAAIVVLGIAPGRLLSPLGPQRLAARISTPGLGFWFSLPRVAIWAALLLPLASAVLLYRSRDQILDRVGAWWPLLERLWPLNSLYRALDRLLAVIGSLIWGGTQVIEGAGYMAWVVLACLVIFLLVLRQT